MKKNIILASSLAAAALLVASPAMADSHRFDKGDRSGINLEKITRFLDQDRGGWKSNKNDKGDDRDRSNATTTTSISGTVTAINGTVITLSGKDAAVYTVQAANAAITSGDRTIALADIRVGDVLKVKGSVSGTVFVATKIHDKSIYKREALAKLDDLRAGIVTSVTGNAFTMTRFGTGTSATITTNASTTFKVNGQATTSAAIAPGSAVIVVGTTSTTTANTFAGNVVYVITKSFGWLKHLLVR